MTTTTTQLKIRNPSVAITSVTSMEATGNTPWVKLTKGATIQVTGTATSITYVVQRSSVDPTGTANTAAVASPVSGNLTTGLQTSNHIEYGVAWWRVSVSVLTGGNATVSISGMDASNL